jgi:hypothetical protein
MSIFTTDYASRIKKLSDTGLQVEMAAGENSAFCESYGNDHEARSNAMLEYRTLAREWTRRKLGFTPREVRPR